MNEPKVQPLLKSANSTVIVIDALDEYKDREFSSAILSVLGPSIVQSCSDQQLSPVPQER
jgi:hypothetical protein